ncbi:hypothetical protein [Sinorhizobium meliloti]|uniref:nSTAND1 domain-containing NTPase n=1 Tax=Rhizobium meliloti TaxID=382 RepID=UPI00299DA023|nr:hypothetical protein [Sinorhizobium meliloti]MDW9690562.1 hypothetical protein [Sinorhizobium meliloti]MDW9715407.1 hypothetical protein [Sinorhizobium meliloti]MDW9756645.1 hypothetical protein [Sinorhizobium meliloti]
MDEIPQPSVPVATREAGAFDYGRVAAEFPNECKRRSTADKPYMGTRSYQLEDADLFFGRQRETSELVALLLRGPLSVLHAPSGAGKSSILNARIIPEIERSGVNAVRMTPENNPLEALRISTLLQLIPAPETEAAALGEFLRHFPKLAGEKIEAAIDQYDTIEISDPLRRKLIAPYDVKVWFDPGRQRAGVTTPYFCRLLNGTATIRSYWRHFAALFDLDEFGSEIRQDAWRDARLGKIHELMASERARRAHREWIDRLDLPEFGFVGFLHHFWSQWAATQSGYAVCIVVDQFEEIFTRFTDLQAGEAEEDAPGSAVENPGVARPDWQLRPSFFLELHRLLTPSEQPGGAPLLPVSVVLSMRDEFLGQLRAVPEIRRLWEHAQYRLDFIDQRDAHRVIREPARAYGYDYGEACYQKIVSDLLREERYIEPAQIQIVCEKLWDKLGSKLHAAAGQDAAVGRRVIDLDTFERETGGPKQILRRHFGDTLAELDAADRIEAIDMLVPLLTSQGTRNVVEVTEIVRAPFRDPEKRAAILRHLEGRNIVRVEARLGGRFVEITHEFLLKPLQEEIARRAAEMPDEQAFRFALRSLAAARAGMGSERAQAERVSEPVLRILLRETSPVFWNDWAVRLVLRAALIHGAKREEYGRLRDLFAEVVSAKRSAEIEELKRGSTEMLRDWLVVQRDSGNGLDRDEIETMRTVFLPKLAAEPALGGLLVEVCLTSALSGAGAAEEELVRQWTRLALEQADEIRP